MKVSKSKYWAIIITLIFHVILLYVLLLNEVTKYETYDIYELEMETQDHPKEPEVEQNKTKELDKEPVKEILTNLASKQLLKGEQFKEEEVTKQLIDEFNKRKETTDKILNAKDRKPDISVSKHTTEKTTAKKPPKTIFYVGQSSVQYFLAERYRVNLPIPIYKCEGGGTVKVSIIVNAEGRVIEAEIIDNINATECMQDAAVKAALSSSFSKRKHSHKLQKGRIVYKFVAQ